MRTLAINEHMRAGRDYRVWQAYLPDGYVVVDSVSLRFAY